MKIKVNGSLTPSERERTIAELACMGQAAKLDEMQVRGDYCDGHWTGYDYRDQKWIVVEAA